METEASTQQVDEKLYSRQLYVMGHEAQQKMMVSDVLIVGLSGLGVEVAKNVILAGVKSVTLYDPNPVTSFDLGGNFYFQESDIGKPRAQTCISKLAELNQYVPVKVINTMSPQGMSCCCVTIPLPSADLTSLNEKCRTSNCAFIYSQVAGVFSQVFCDFGAEFIVSDKDGENPQMSQIEAITVSNPGVVKVLEDQGRHGLETGDTVKFSKVQGMPELDETEHEVKVTGPFTFEIGDCSSFSAAATQGYINQIKKPTKVTFKPYTEALETPGEIMMTDFAKFDRPPLLHAGFRGLAAHVDENGTIAPGDASAADKVLAATKTFFDGDLSDDQVDIINKLAIGSCAVLSPMCAAIGGIVGQEVLKSCSGKFTPINGFFYFDATETLADSLDAADVAPRNSRYDSQIAVFGYEAQKALLDLNYFLVGGGAIGCEMLKNWALMGVGCGEKGHITITDMDRIEKSNLSRQFLFRNTDINSAKSTTGAKAAKVMNSSMNITPMEQRVGADTENVFGDAFYDKLDGVCTALDNVEARLYMDQRCVFYGLPMLESGTLGTKGNTQIVVPKLTENYGATRDPPEKSIPVCTLKNFPNMIQHTLQWARDYFEGDFKQVAEDVNSYLSSPDFEETLNKQPNTKLDTVLNIKKTLVDERPYSFEDCIVWSRLKFEKLFNNDIRQLLHNFPPDQKTSTGTPFWSGTKRCPTPLVFDVDAVCEDAEMKNHFDFIVATANMRAEMYGIKGHTDEAVFKEVLSNVIVPDFAPKDGVKIAANEAEAKEESKGEAPPTDEDASSILANLPAPASLAGFRLSPVEFDKDIDDHMLFVTACSNLRALNYQIPTKDTHTSRAIAGKIIPAIATTTAMVTGLICLELYKLIGTPKKELTAEAYKSAFCNLAIPFMTLSEPQPPKATPAMLKGKEWKWTAWDSLEMNVGDVTLAEFMNYWKDEYGLDVSMLSFGVAMLFSAFANKAKLAERMPKKMSTIVEEIRGEKLPEEQLFLVFEMVTEDADGEDVDLPYVKYRFR